MALQEKKYSVQKSAHTWYINTSFRFRGKKVYHYIYFFQSLSEFGKTKDYYGKTTSDKRSILKKSYEDNKNDTQ